MTHEKGNNHEEHEAHEGYPMLLLAGMPDPVGVFFSTAILLIFVPFVGFVVNYNVRNAC